MPDPIRAALEAAAKVLVAEGMESIMPDEGLRDQWLIEPPTDIAMRQTAAAVAAFLRALPDEFDLPVTFDSGKTDILEFGIPDADIIADAVEAAAKEPRDE